MFTFTRGTAGWVLASGALWLAALSTGDMRTILLSRTLFAAAITVTVIAAGRGRRRSPDLKPGERVISDQQLAQMIRAVAAGLKADADIAGGIAAVSLRRRRSAWRG